MNMLFDQDPGFISAVKDHFEQKIANLHELHKASSLNNNKFHFEIILLSCCYIDALAGIFTDEKEVSKRFIELLIAFGGTNDIDFAKINLIFLSAKIREPIKNKPMFPQKYNKWISDEIGKRDYSRGDNTALDLTYDIILGKLFELSTEQEKKIYGDILKEKLRKSTYAGVLYENYRKPAVHEALTRGHWSTGHEDKPFYVSIIDLEPDFSFPPAFLIAVVENILHELYRKCEEMFYKDEFV